MFAMQNNNQAGLPRASRGGSKKKGFSPTKKTSPRKSCGKRKTQRCKKSAPGFKRSFLKLVAFAVGGVSSVVVDSQQGTVGSFTVDEVKEGNLFNLGTGGAVASSFIESVHRSPFEDFDKIVERTAANGLIVDREPLGQGLHANVYKVTTSDGTQKAMKVPNGTVTDYNDLYAEGGNIRTLESRFDALLIAKERAWSIAEERVENMKNELERELKNSSDQIFKDSNFERIMELEQELAKREQQLREQQAKAAELDALYQKYFYQATLHEIPNGDGKFDTPVLVEDLFATDLETLTKSTEFQNLPPETQLQAVTTVLYHLLKQVEFLNQLEISHTDIKPQNLMLDFDGNLKMVDWSLMAFSEKEFHGVQVGKIKEINIENGTVQNVDRWSFFEQTTPTYQAPDFVTTWQTDQKNQKNFFWSVCHKMNCFPCFFKKDKKGFYPENELFSIGAIIGRMLSPPELLTSRKHFFQYKCVDCFFGLQNSCTCKCVSHSATGERFDELRNTPKWAEFLGAEFSHPETACKDLFHVLGTLLEPESAKRSSAEELLKHRLFEDMEYLQNGEKLLKQLALAVN